jgi:glycosyltransferase involved in cell wall biosynthesis
MKILHVISSVDPAGGGPIEGLKQLTLVAQSNGHIIEIASLDPPGAPYLKDFPARVHALGPAKFKYRYSDRLLPWLRAHATRYDIAVVEGIWQYHSFAVRQALHRSPVPYVVFTHGMLDPWFKRTYPLKHLKKWLYWPWADYRVLRDAAAVLFTCEEERLLARESFWLYSAREKVLTYGTTAPPANLDAERQNALSRFPELRDKRIILFMGRIHPKKGCDLVIEAFAKTLATDPSWHLVMAGPDQIGWEASLRAMAAELNIADRITWTGMVGGDTKYGLLAASEAMFLPSHQENFGLIVAEALACSVPVLISDKVNIWREVKSDAAGLVANDNLSGACELLRNWIAMDAGDRDSMRARARGCFEKRFEINKVSASLISALQAITKPRILQSSAA